MKHTLPIIATASSKNVRIAPRKMRLVLGLVRGMNVELALHQLRFSHKAGADVLAKVIDSAASNAKQSRQVELGDLVISHLTCDMGTTLKRTQARARGSAFLIRRKNAHVNVGLSLVKGVEAKAKKVDSSAKNPVVKPGDTSEVETKVEKAAASPKPSVVKTGEQVKANKVTQKRRLFNRKGGEA